jgi:hypothetical protein
MDASVKPLRLGYWELSINEAQLAYEQDKLLFTAIRQNDEGDIITLIDRGAYIDEKFFEVCIVHKKMQLIMMMIDRYPYVIQVSKKTLSRLCTKYHTNRTVLKHVLEHCCVTNMYDIYDPLLHASINGDMDMLTTINRRFPFACELLYSPFFWAAKSGHVHVVSYLYDLCKKVDDIHMSNTLLNVVHECSIQADKIYSCAPVIRLLVGKQNCTLFHCVEKCFEKKNAFVLALLLPFLHHGCFSLETPQNIVVVYEALRLRRAVSVIVRAFKKHRRMMFVKTMYKAMKYAYSPSIVEIIAKHGNIL